VWRVHCHPFIILPIVGRFSKIFHHWIEQEIALKSRQVFRNLLPLIETTILISRNLKCFYHFSTTAVTKTFRLTVYYILWVQQCITLFFDSIFIPEGQISLHLSTFSNVFSHIQSATTTYVTDQVRRTFLQSCITELFTYRSTFYIRQETTVQTGL